MMKNIQKCLIFMILIVLFIPIVYATTLEDISYHYSSGMYLEAKAKFDEASQHYKDCLNLTIENNKSSWKELCEDDYNRTSKITMTRIKDLLIVKSMDWTFKGELLNSDEVTQYFLTKNSELVVVRTHKFNRSLGNKDIDFLLSFQKLDMKNIYSNIQESNFSYNKIKIKYIVGSNEKNDSSSFIGMYFDDSSKELYSIMTSVSDINSFLKDFGVYPKNYLQLGVTNSQLIGIAVAAIILIAIIIFILIRTHRLKI